MTKADYFKRVVAELNLDTRDPFTLLFANACALQDQRDYLHDQNTRLHEALEAVCSASSHDEVYEIARAALAKGDV